MSLSETIRAIHALACLRHTEVEPHRIGIVITPRLEGADFSPGTSLELAEIAEWEAQVRLGSGQWGHAVAMGKAPEDALAGLLNAYVDAHNAVDRRRASLFQRLPILHGK